MPLKRLQRSGREHLRNRAAQSGKGPPSPLDLTVLPTVHRPYDPGATLDKIAQPFEKRASLRRVGCRSPELSDRRRGATPRQPYNVASPRRPAEANRFPRSPVPRGRSALRTFRRTGSADTRMFACRGPVDWAQGFEATSCSRIQGMTGLAAHRSFENVSSRQHDPPNGHQTIGMIYS